VVGLAAVEEGARLLGGIGIDALATKAGDLTDFVVAAADEQLAGLGFAVATPRDRDHRGAHVALHHDDAWRVCRALIERAAVVPDFREPDIVRLGFAPAYTRFVDAWRAIDRIRTLVTARAHEAMPQERRRVT
jgi:kynureninase